MEEKQHDIVFANDEEHRKYIIAAVKRIVYRYDENADIILFGAGLVATGMKKATGIFWY